MKGEEQTFFIIKKCSIVLCEKIGFYSDALCMLGDTVYVHR